VARKLWKKTNWMHEYEGTAQAQGLPETIVKRAFREKEKLSEGLCQNVAMFEENLRKKDQEERRMWNGGRISGGRKSPIEVGWGGVLLR